MTHCKRYIGILLAMVVVLGASAQNRSPENLPKFDSRKLHFGFILAYNSADFIVELNDDYIPGADSLVAVEHASVPGFNIQIVSSLALTPGLRLRFLPGLSFQDRVLNFKYLQPDKTVQTVEKRVDATFLEFPLDLKFRTMRLGNFATYFMGGVKYGIDMSSQSATNNEGMGTESIVKIKKHNFSYEVGIGADFFLEFFKFGLEVKYAFGSKNVLIQDNTMFSSPIESLRTKLWTISFTFEG